MNCKSPRKAFTLEEKKLILNYVKNNKSVIENKSNETGIVKARQQKWEELSNIFSAKRFDRDWQRIREYYHRMKCNAKAIIIAYKKHVKETGNLPVNIPTDYDWAVYEITPEDFNEGENTTHMETPQIGHIKQENFEETFYEDINYESENRYKIENFVETVTSEPNINQRKRHYSNFEESESYGCNDYNAESNTASNTELEIVAQKNKLDLEFREKKIEFARQKHMKDMENANLYQQKLKFELETAKLARIKMKKETEKIDLELLLLKRQVSNT